MIIAWQREFLTTWVQNSISVMHTWNKIEPTQLIQYVCSDSGDTKRKWESISAQENWNSSPLNYFLTNNLH